MLRRLFCTLALLSLISSAAPPAEFLPGAHRIVFLGDSITYAGQYIDYFEAHLLAHYPQRQFDVLDLGLPSETVSGLSEAGHAGGKFPRPGVHERLARVLAKMKPDFVFACYGMNDGIYMPFSEERFQAFREGMQKLHAAAIAAGAKIIHLTPPVYDGQPVRAQSSADGIGAPFIGYDEVLARYSAWLLEQRAQGWTVIDIHTPMRAALDARRAAAPDFAYAKDGVHANPEGHLVIANALLKGLGENPDAGAANNGEAGALLKLLAQRRSIRGNAWLTACGHQRPGMAAGLPIDQAEAKAAALAPQIAAKIPR